MRAGYFYYRSSVTGLGQLNRFVLELSSKTWLWFWHRDLLFKIDLSTFYHSTIPGEDHMSKGREEADEACVEQPLLDP